MLVVNGGEKNLRLLRQARQLVLLPRLQQLALPVQQRHQPVQVRQHRQQLLFDNYKLGKCQYGKNHL